jgi:hypothetical protein
VEAALDRKALLRQYKETPRPAGIFAVRNVAEDRLLIGVSTDLPGMLNRQRFQLEMGSHPDKALQADWNRLGADAFAFEVLDELEPLADGDSDVHEDLCVLRDEWFERLSSAGHSFYPTAASGT